MAKDPVCGMDVREEGAAYLLHFEHKTLYFCSKQCKDAFQAPGQQGTTKKKTAFARFLEKLAENNKQTYGGGPPKCH